MNSPRFAVNSPGVIAESVDGEVLIINLESGAYYSADGSGEEIWALLAAGVAIDEAVDHLALRYGPSSHAAIAAAVQRMADELLAEQLLVPSSDRVPQLDPPALAACSFAEPLLQKYTDMQDLLMLDPIHEVTEEGWPNIRPNTVAPTGQ
jgi:hypothetical protein